MKVILLYVSSVDGKVTQWHQPHIHSWTSAEDITHFRKSIEETKLLVMGSSTFDVVQPKPEAGILRIVLTRKPEAYKNYETPGQLEFYNLSPTQLVEELAKKGHTQMLLVSGRTVTTEFLKEKLVSEIWLTIEPKIFGTGDPMVQEEKLDVQLELLEVKKLNSKGTLLLKYRIDNDS